jgi:cytochrome c2
VIRASVIAALVIVAAFAAASAIWDNSSHAGEVPGGDAARGRASIIEFGCGTCHTIPGVTAAHGLVGPSLADFARHAYVAGRLPNDPENVVRWIRFPQETDPGNAMPDLGVPELAARDITAYLYSIARPERAAS